MTEWFLSSVDESNQGFLEKGNVEFELDLCYIFVLYSDDALRWMLCLVPYFPIICIPFIVVLTQCLVLRAFMSVYGVYVTLWAVLMFLWGLAEGHIVPVNIEHYNAALDIETVDTLVCFFNIIIHITYFE